MFLSNSHSNEIFWEHPVSPIFTVSYSNPAIDFIRGGQHLRTNGNEEVVLVGINFGPKDLNFQIFAEYGPEGIGICAKNCHVKVAHTEIVCYSGEGRGTNHRWTVWVGHGRKSLPSIAKTSYGQPYIEEIKLTETSLNTRGGETIEIFGSNFATSTTVWYGCLGKRNVLAPPIKVVYSNILGSGIASTNIFPPATSIQYEARECKVTGPHKNGL